VQPESPALSPISNAANMTREEVLAAREAKKAAKAAKKS